LENFPIKSRGNFTLQDEEIPNDIYAHTKIQFNNIGWRASQIEDVVV
jgi:hypothetical protein